MDNENAVVVQENKSYIAPVVDIQSALARRDAFKEFVSQILVEGTDFGAVPGTEKPTLKKPGAEKLGTFFGLRPTFEPLEVVEDWTGKDHGGEAFFYYRYKSKLWRAGELIGEGIGSCNSFEKKYRYRWVNEMDLPDGLDVSRFECRDGSICEFLFAIDKGETSGKYGKPAEYWNAFRDAIANGTAERVMRKTKKGDEFEAYKIGGKLYAIPNRDAADLVNTIDKMAQKRAFVAAILIATNASDYFTQDIEDFDDKPINTVDAEFKDPEPKSKIVRPLTQEKLCEAIAKKADSYRKAGFVADEKLKKQFVIDMSKLCLNDDNIRHKVCKYLFGSESLKEIDDANIKAGLDWMNFGQTQDGDWVPGTYVVKELQAVVDHISGEIHANGDAV